MNVLSPTKTDLLTPSLIEMLSTPFLNGLSEMLSFCSMKDFRIKKVHLKLEKYTMHANPE